MKLNICKKEEKREGLNEMRGGFKKGSTSIPKIYEGDCMEAMRQMSDKSFDLAIVDPPYFDGPQSKVYYGKSVSSTNVPRLAKNSKHWKKVDPEYFKELKRICRAYIFFGCNYYNFDFHSGRIVWDKINSLSNFSDCEIAATNLFDHVRMFSFMWNGMLQGKSISEGRIAQGNKALNEKRIHPTQKPVALYKWLLKNYANHNDKILDTHGGSMSSAIACYDLGFDLTLYEIDHDHFEAGRNRLESHMAQGRLFFI